MGVRHQFVNRIPDVEDDTIVRPSDWNADHVGVSYHHVQAVPETVWTVNHDLGRYPSVAVLDSAGSQIEVAVSHQSLNVVVLTLAYAISGTADCT